MHPAWSVILFTTLSGSGYGLLAVLGLQWLLAPDALSSTTAWAALLIGSTLAVTGLTASLAHLGQPRRAWRALSQWRSSWLSREGVAALASFVPIVLAALALLGADGMRPVVGAALLLAAASTVYCTARIYTSLPPIPAWRQATVVPAYLLLAVAGGLLWALPLWAIGGTVTWPGYAAAIAAVLAILLKRRYWSAIDAEPLPVDLAAATGAHGARGLRPLEAPHTEPNYLLREMGFVLARRHARRLRRIVQALWASATVLALLVAWTGTAPLALLPAVLALLCGQLGIVVERWLFFAQARHLVTVYYGATGDPTRVHSADFTVT